MMWRRCEVYAVKYRATAGVAVEASEPLHLCGRQRAAALCTAELDAAAIELQNPHSGLTANGRSPLFLFINVAVSPRCQR